MSKSRKGLIGYAIVAGLLIAARVALPWFVQDYVNRTLSRSPAYDGEIGDVDLHLYRGAYQIEDVHIVKTEGAVPVPLFSAPVVDLSVEWRALFHGSLVGEVHVERGSLNFVAADSAAQSQTGEQEDWADVVRELFPLRINRFVVHDSEVHFRNFSSDPQVDLYLAEVNAEASNLTNSLDLSRTLTARLEGTAVAQRSGNLKMDLDFNPYLEHATFDLNVSLTDLELTELNAFLRAYGNFDVSAGKFSAFGEFVAKEGRFEGYLKPILTDVEVFRWKTDSDNPLEFLWEGAVAVLAEVFQNQRRDQVATEIPFSGSFEDPESGLWSSILNLLRNAFVRGLLPGIEDRLSPGQMDQEGDDERQE